MGVVFNGRAGTGLTLYADALCTSRGGALAATIDDGPILGDRVTIGAASGVIGPVKVGDDTTIAFRAQLCQDVPADAVVLMTTKQRVRTP